MSKEPKASNIGNSYKYATKTDDIVIKDRGCAKLMRGFFHIGCFVDLLLEETEDVKSRINQSSKSMSDLKRAQEAKDVHLGTTVTLQSSMPLNMLL